jgi:hypothetical protein
LMSDDPWEKVATWRPPVPEPDEVRLLQRRGTKAPV